MALTVMNGVDGRECLWAGPCAKQREGRRKLLVMSRMISDIAVLMFVCVCLRPFMQVRVEQCPDPRVCVQFRLKARPIHQQGLNSFSQRACFSLLLYAPRVSCGRLALLLADSNIPTPACADRAPGGPGFERV